MLPDTLQVKQSLQGQKWLHYLLLAVLFTPSIRLPGNIPIRIDDVLVFGVAAILTVKYLLGTRMSRLDAVFAYTAAVAATTLLSALLAPDHLDITAKEYLDCLRPIKFFLVYWIVRDLSPAASLRTFIRTVSAASFILLATEFLEIFFARTAPGSIFVRFFSLFTEKSPDLVVDMMATRPFGTFNTPPDLGYIACICLFIGPLIPSPRRRKIVVAVFFLILLVSATRILLFSLPLLLILQAFLRATSIKQAFQRVRFSLALIAVAVASSAVLLPLVSPQASEFTQGMIVAAVSGDTGDQDSITTRLGNLYLVDYTLTRAPVLGVGSRSLLPDFVDSELILTFHRYGFAGFAALLLIYPLGYTMARQIAGVNRELHQLAIIALAITFIAGITLGALTNSRIGVLLFVILGIVAASKKAASGARVAVTERLAPNIPDIATAQPCQLRGS